MRRWAAVVFALLAVLLAPSGAAGQDVAEKLSRVARFHPADTLAVVSVPDAETLLAVLGRAGEDREALAGRLARRAGKTPTSLLAMLEIAAATLDGPITFSLHPPAVVGQTEPTFLVAAESGAPQERLDQVHAEVLRRFVAPAFAKAVFEESLMGLKISRLGMKEGDLFVARAEGAIYYSPSAPILGQVLFERQQRTGRTLANDPVFRRSLRGLADRVDPRDRAGVLFARDARILPLLEKLGAEGPAAGILVKKEGGWRDEVDLTVTGGVLGGIRGDGPVPGAWRAGKGDGVWAGGSFTPAGAAMLAAEMLGPVHGMRAMWIDAAVKGPGEVFLRPGKAPVLRFPLKEGADLKRTLGPLKGLCRVEGGVLFLSADKGALAAVPVGEERTVSEDGGAVVAFQVPTLLAALGRPGAPGRVETVWSIRPIELGWGKGVRITTGAAEVGAFQAMVASLLR